MINKVITMASSWGWCILEASSSVKVMACSSGVLVLGDHPECWTFCTTFRYVFFELDDWPVKLPPTIILISPSKRSWRLIYLRLQLLILIVSSQEIPRFPLSNEIFNLLLEVKTFISVMPVISMEATILILIVLIGVSLHFLWPL